MEMIIDIVLLFLLVVSAFVAIRMKDLLSAAIVLGAYSLVMAVVWMRLNAVDVAFTEASVGAGITAVLIIAALSRTARGEDGFEGGSVSRPRRKAGISKLLSFVVVVVIGGMLIYGTMDMPDYGDPHAPANHHLAERFIHEGYHETGSVNYVTGILANYRGHDTLGETTVIFTAGIAVIVLLRRRKKRI